MMIRVSRKGYLHIMVGGISIVIIQSLPRFAKCGEIIILGKAFCHPSHIQQQGEQDG